MPFFFQLKYPAKLQKSTPFSDFKQPTQTGTLFFGGLSHMPFVMGYPHPPALPNQTFLSLHMPVLSAKVGF